MHPLIEHYLAQVGIQLKDLSSEKRSEELHEIRQHLQFIVDKERDQGLSEGEAVQAALLQFGPYRKVGRELNAAVLNHAPRLSKAFSAMTTVMIAQAVLRLLLSCLMAANMSRMLVAIESAGGVVINGGGEERILWSLAFSLVHCAVSIQMAVLLRRLRTWAFYPTLILLSFESISEANGVFRLASVFPNQSLFSFSSLLLCSTLFCLSVLILNRKRYFRLASVKRST